jgi:hypothetical protein
MAEDDSPTRKDSGTLGIFESTAREALQALDAEGLDERGEELRHEARELVTVFQAWKERRPEAEDRTAAISRVMTLHRNVAEYMVERRARGI